MDIAGLDIAQTEAAKFPSPLKEFSVIYTDRAMNLMAAPFTNHMQELSSVLKDTYQADHTCFVPGAGHFAMEAVARQFATDENVMWFVMGSSHSVGVPSWSRVRSP